MTDATYELGESTPQAWDFLKNAAAIDEAARICEGRQDRLIMPLSEAVQTGEHPFGALSIATSTTRGHAEVAMKCAAKAAARLDEDAFKWSPSSFILLSVLVQPHGLTREACNFSGSCFSEMRQPARGKAGRETG